MHFHTGKSIILLVLATVNIKFYNKKHVIL